MADIAVFPAAQRSFDPYLGDAASPEKGISHIARLVGSDRSKSIGAGVVIYERMTVDWALAFEEVVIVIEGKMVVRSSDKTYECAAGDVAWFPAHAALRYEVPDRVAIFYATYPIASTLQGRGTGAKISPLV